LKTNLVRLENIIKIRHGWAFKSKFFSEENINKPVLVNIGNFKYDGGFRFENTKIKRYVGEYPLQYELKPNEILLIMTCQTSGGEILGVPAKVPNDSETYLHNQRLGKVEIIEKSLVEEDFLYWLFLSPDFNRHLFLSASGTKILHTSPDRIESYQFSLPSLEKQKKISDILRSIQDKIDLNIRMNETIEESAMTLYRNYLVEFNGYHIEDFVESEIGLIPKEWKVVSIYEIANYINGKAFKQKDLHEVNGLPVIKIAELRSGVTPATRYYSNEIEEKYKLTDGDVLFAWSASLGVYLWSNGAAVLNQHIFNVKPKKEVSISMLYFILKNVIQEFIDIAAGRATTMGHITQQHLKDKKIALPPKALLTELSSHFEHYYKLILNNLKETNNLLNLRDYLLPRLLSGEIDPTEAKKKAEKVI
jgi:type I restriction enzyme, S subunit